MNFGQAMNELESLGTAQNRKVYARHGVGKKMFGVSYGNLGKLKRKIGTDHALAMRLWRSGNHDARVLATMIADPASLDTRTLDAWVKNLDNYPASDAFSGLVAETPFAKKKLKQWCKSREEWIGAVGWNVLTRLSLRDSSLPDEFFEPYLDAIESKVHRSRNRVRYAMNSALIAIGTRSKRLEKQAIAAAKRIGVVEVDHGETGCKTPDAVTYIQKINARRRKRSPRA